jgi:hypothetical protein
MQLDLGDDFVNEFVAGAIAATFAAIGFFFWRFWQKSADRFYVLFAAAFWILSLNRAMTLSSSFVTTEGLPIYYIVRLIAFLLILAAIIDKNYGSK